MNSQNSEKQDEMQKENDNYMDWLEGIITINKKPSTRNKKNKRNKKR